MKTTTWTCDLCFSEHTTPRQMWEIHLNYKHMDPTFSPYLTLYSSKEICRQCVDRLGILVKPTLPITEPPPPSFETVIRELIATLIEENKSNE